ncbi:MAG: hypothetical protein ACXW3S_16145, partial [Rhodoplanes sp.]
MDNTAFFRDRIATVLQKIGQTPKNRAIAAGFVFSLRGPYEFMETISKRRADGEILGVLAGASLSAAVKDGGCYEEEVPCNDVCRRMFGEHGFRGRHDGESAGRAAASAQPMGHRVRRGRLL